MTRYRKKPVVIEAWQIGSAEPAPEWLESAFSDGAAEPIQARGTTRGILINTLEGQLIGSRGAWIIRGVKGELYPCDDEIFRMTYDEERGDIVDA